MQMHNRMERAKSWSRYYWIRINWGMSIEDLDSEEKEVLKFLLNRDGWARFSVVEERFESMDGMGFIGKMRLPVPLSGDSVF